MDIHQLLMSLNVSDIRGLTFHHLMAFVRLVCMAKPFVHQRMSGVYPPARYPCTLDNISSGYLDPWCSAPNYPEN
jgi:hypothetical protein